MKISVITVAYNSASTIADTLRSVASQTYLDVEHLVVDGASRDGTADVVREHGAHVAKFVSERDRGIYDAMNKGIKLSQGEVIGFINSDDFYASREVLASVAKVFADPAVDASFGDLCYVQQADTSKIVRYWRSSPFVPGMFGRGWVPPHPTLFVRRRVYEQYGVFDLDYPIAADFELMARLIGVHRVRTVYMPQVLVKMRLGGTTNRNLSNIIKQNREIWRALHVHELEPSVPRFVVGKLLSRGTQFLARPA